MISNSSNTDKKLTLMKHVLLELIECQSYEDREEVFSRVDFESKTFKNHEFENIDELEDWIFEMTNTPKIHEMIEIHV